MGAMKALEASRHFNSLANWDDAEEAQPSLEMAWSTDRCICECLWTRPPRFWSHRLEGWHARGHKWLLNSLGPGGHLLGGGRWWQGVAGRVNGMTWLGNAAFALQLVQQLHFADIANEALPTHLSVGVESDRNTANEFHDQIKPETEAVCLRLRPLGRNTMLFRPPIDQSQASS